MFKADHNSRNSALFPMASQKATDSGNEEHAGKVEIDPNFEPTPIHEMHDVLPLYRSVRRLPCAAAPVPPTAPQNYLPGFYQPPPPLYQDPAAIYHAPPVHHHHQQQAVVPHHQPVSMINPPQTYQSSLLGRATRQSRDLTSASVSHTLIQPVSSSIATTTTTTAIFPTSNSAYSDSGSSVGSERSFNQKAPPPSVIGDRALDCYSEHEARESGGGSDAKAKKKKKRKTLDDPNAILPALSPYNFFFRVERESLIDQAEALQDDGSSLNDLATEWSDCDWSEDRRISILHKHWYRDRSVRRKHRKTHGKIDFTTYVKDCCLQIVCCCCVPCLPC